MRNAEVPSIDRKTARSLIMMALAVGPLTACDVEPGDIRRLPAEPPPQAGAIMQDGTPPPPPECPDAGNCVAGEAPEQQAPCPRSFAAFVGIPQEADVPAGTTYDVLDPRDDTLLFRLSTDNRGRLLRVFEEASFCPPWSKGFKVVPKPMAINPNDNRDLSAMPPIALLLRLEGPDPQEVEIVTCPMSSLPGTPLPPPDSDSCHSQEPRHVEDAPAEDAPAATVDILYGEDGRVPRALGVSFGSPEETCNTCNP